MKVRQFCLVTDINTYTSFTRNVIIAQCQMPHVYRVYNMYIVYNNIIIVSMMNKEYENAIML